jgi:hypothetical protein
MWKRRELKAFFSGAGSLKKLRVRNIKMEAAPFNYGHKGG